MTKIDTKKVLKNLYGASAKEVAIVEVPPLRYLMVDGQGDPNSAPAYEQAIEALYSVAYTAKFMVKKSPGALDFAVMPLESLWWADDMRDFATGNKARWKWTAMVMQPDCATDAAIDSAIAEVRKKKAPVALDKLRLAVLEEGRCAQILHIGPFSEEGPTIEKVHAFIEARSTLIGKHHEIYLSDIRRAAPEKWKTIIRQPMQ